MINRLTIEEKMRFKLNLNRAISKWLENETIKDNNLGWLPDDVVTLMTESAFNILETVNSLNFTLQNEELLK